MSDCVFLWSFCVLFLCFIVCFIVHAAFVRIKLMMMMLITVYSRLSVAVLLWRYAVIDVTPQDEHHMTVLQRLMITDHQVGYTDHQVGYTQHHVRITHLPNTCRIFGRKQKKR